MRMPDIEKGSPRTHAEGSEFVGLTHGVLFDYGRTLVTFDYPTEDLLNTMREFRPRIAAALGEPAPEAEAILHNVLLPLENYVASISEDEVEYMDVYRETWAKAGLVLPDELLHNILDSEQRCWDRAVRLDPDALQVLAWLGAHGIKSGVCSNAPFPPEMMHVLFVGDRVREDYEGPRSLGMRAVVFTAHSDEPPPEGVPTIASLSELTRLL